jgi:hypothetical protein
MRRLLFTLALSSLSLSAAGVRLQSEMTDIGTGTVTKMDMLLDQMRMRVNMVGPKNSTSVLFLTDGGRDRMVMLDTAKNEYTEMDKATIDKMAQQMQGAMGQMQAMMDKMPPAQRAAMEKAMKGMPGQMKGAAAAAALEKPVYSAKGGSSVNGFSCTKYDGVSKGQKVVELCAAAPSVVHFAPTDYAVFERMKKFTEGLRQMAANSPVGGLDFSAFTDPGYQGIPVAQTTFSNGKATMKTEVKSIKSASFSDADFSLGSATKREMPGMPSARTAPGKRK